MIEIVRKTLAVVLTWEIQSNDVIRGSIKVEREGCRFLRDMAMELRMTSMSAMQRKIIR